MSVKKSNMTENLRMRAEDLLAQDSENFLPADIEDINKLHHELAVHQAELELQNEELRNTQLSLQKVRDRYVELYENAPVGYVLLDASGIIRRTNSTWRAMLGRPDDDFLGTPFAETLMKDDAQVFLSRFRSFFHNPTQKQMELCVKGPQSEHFHAHITAKRSYDEGTKSNTNELMVIVSDITERKLAQLALEQKNEELEQFVYSVSHDLKSPLVTVKSFVGMLRQDLLKADQSRINKDLNYIDKAADKMQQLLDALLQYSRIGRVEAPVQILSASQTVEDCLNSLAGILQQYQVQVSTSDMPYQLHGIPLHFGQLWQNLIENAVKYKGDQPLSHIEIGATQQRHDVVFYVCDNGIGIAPEHSDRIFNLFSQLNPSSGGSGLGLALAKKIVSIYQGRIWVESAGEGKGSCFMFTLPRAIQPQPLRNIKTEERGPT